MPTKSDSSPTTVDARIRVRYAETDQMGVVYHSNFIIWFEVGRVELLRRLGFSYREMEQQDGVHIAVVDVHCRYRAPARYDDEIVVRTQVTHLRGSLMHFGYRVLRESDQTLLAEGETIHIIVNRHMEKISLPEKYAAKLRDAASPPK